MHHSLNAELWVKLKYNLKMKSKSILTTGLVCLALSLSFCFTTLPTSPTNFYKELLKYCAGLPTEFAQISEERKKELIEIGNYVIEQRVARKRCDLLFICTSNSRRSHMAQVWAYTASLYYGVDSVLTFSGGTEATSVHPNTVSALRRAGFSVETSQAGDNPNYFVAAGNTLGQWAIYSKKYNHTMNPKSNFCAVMVCSEADKSCPSVDGADLRIALSYEDPKYYDNTPSQNQKYDERCRQIAREQFFMMDYVKQKLIQTIESKK